MYNELQIIKYDELKTPSISLLKTIPLHTDKEIAPNFLHLFGKPDFGLKAETDDSTFDIQLWFYTPPSAISQENTVIYTVGLSNYTFDSPCPKIELSFQFPGQFQRWQLEKLGRLLGTFIHDTLKVTHFTPNLLLTGLKRPFMPAMWDILVIEGAGMRPLWIELEDQAAIRMLHLLPVYTDEVPLIQQLGFWNTYRQLIHQKINFLAPNRPKLSKIEFHPDDLQLARVVPVYQAPRTLEQLRMDIQHWYQINAPTLPAAHHQVPQVPTGQAAFWGLHEERYQAQRQQFNDHERRWLTYHWEAIYAGNYQVEENHLKTNAYFSP